MPDQPTTPPMMTALAEGAAAMHEWFCSLLAAGFTEDQALKLIVLSVHHSSD